MLTPVRRRINHLAPQLSRFNPKFFYWIFIPADLICLALQAAGGALSTQTNGSSDTGVNITMAGLVLQVVVIFLFIVAFADYMVRYIRDPITQALTSRVRVFLSFLALAVVLILGRSIYRAYELSQGYRDSDLITDEGLFIGLEGVYVLTSPSWWSRTLANYLQVDRHCRVFVVYRPPGDAV
jgi:hypothetical protein